MKKHTSTILVILDGFGYSPQQEYNAIYQAYTPTLDYFFKYYPHTLLQASGSAVGLPSGYTSNSQVGHLTIGCGRVVPQVPTFFYNAIENDGSLNVPTLIHYLHLLQRNNSTLHLMGLLSDAGIHSHEEHLYALIKTAIRTGIQHIIIHPFLDGRDTPPQSAFVYLTRLDTLLKEIKCGTIGSIHGRFYAMDRDHNWQRTKKSYEILIGHQTCLKQTWKEAIETYYTQGITDEFIPPTLLLEDGFIKPHDGIIFFNFRPDRARQLASCFTFTSSTTTMLPLEFFITPVSYGTQYKTISLFETLPEQNTLKEVLAVHGKRICSIAETEKYAHITYFFNGYKENPVLGEKRILIPSIKTKDYIQYPYMSAREITTITLSLLKKEDRDFYLINYANPDMVGHSGNFDATVKSIEFLDRELRLLYDTIVTQLNGTLYLTADHGKAETMYNADTKQPHTAHTNNPVPFLMITKALKNKQYTLPLDSLADIAPFILYTMNLPIPNEMQSIKIHK